MNKRKLKFSTCLSYGVGAVGEGIGYNFFFTFFTFFLTTEAGVAPAIAGVISGIAVLWDAITDPIIGSWSDHTRNPKGRRRPLIAKGSILFGLSVALLFCNIPVSVPVKVVFFIAVNMIYWLTMTTCVIPHISLGSELTEDFDERTKLRTFSVTFMGIGTLIAVGTPLLLVDAYTSMTGSSTAGWALAGLTYGALTAAAYQICSHFLKGKEPKNPNLALTGEPPKRKELVHNFLSDAKSAFKNKSLFRLIMITFFVNIVVTLGSALAVFLLQYVYEFNDAQSSLVMTLQGIFVVLAAVVAGALAAKLDKKLVMILSVIVYALAYVIILVLPIAWPVIIASTVLFALGNSGYWTMIYAMSYDSAMVEQVRSGEKPDGLYTSLIGLFMKFGNALGSVVSGVGLQIIGFSEETQIQTAGAITGIRYLYALAPTLFLVIALIFAVAYPLTRKRYEALSAEHEKRLANEPIDKKVLEGL